MFINNDWLTQIPDYIANFLPEGIRYHSPVTPVTIESLHVIARPSRSYKYCNIWASHPSCMEKVEVVLQTPIDGCTMLQIVKKLKLLKKSLR